MNLEKEYKFLNIKNLHLVMLDLNLQKILKKLHKSPMLSLSNAFTEEDLINFEKKLLTYLK